MNSTCITVSPADAKNLQLGSLLRVTISGRVSAMNSYERENGETVVNVDVEGEASIEPGTLDDAARLAFSKLSNAKGPRDFVMGQSELHAP